MNIAVVALGKVGLPVAAALAGRGHHVVGCDTDARLVARVNEGSNPLPHEPGLDDLLPRAVAAGTLSATTDTAAGVRDADVVLALVPVGVDGDARPEFSHMDQAVAAISRGLKPGALVVLETTLPAGTTRTRYLPMLAAGGRGCGRDFFLAFSPERVQSGRVLRDLGGYPRVVGGVDQASARRAAEFYARAYDVEVSTLSSADAAEFCKLAESLYRDVNIALANELARFAEQAGVDYHEIAPVANSQPQSHLHRPGLGVGGHCIPVYPYFVTGATEHARLARVARSINDAMHLHGADLLEAALGGLSMTRVLVLGLTYRPGVKETAHSPALALAAELARRGATVLGSDPLLDAEEIGRLGLRDAPLDAELHADAIVVPAPDPAFASFDFRRVRGLRAILDGAAAVDPADAEAAGAAYLGIGRPSRPAGDGRV